MIMVKYRITVNGTPVFEGHDVIKAEAAFADECSKAKPGDTVNFDKNVGKDWVTERIARIPGLWPRTVWGEA